MKKILLLLLISFATILNSQPPFYVPTNGLIAWYPFNGNANDGSGNGNNGTLYGSATASNYLSVGYNTSDYVTIPSSTLNNLQSFTVTFKIKFNSLNTSGGSPTNHIISGDIPGFEENFGLSYQESVKKWRFAFLNSLYDFTDSTITANTWYCFVLQRSANGDISAYRNNVKLSETYNNTGATYVTSLLIGQETDCTGGCFSLNQCTNGELDNIAIYNRALSVSELEKFCEACSNMVDIQQPLIKSVMLTSNTQFIAISQELNSTFQWQANVANLGWQNIPNNVTYSGATGQVIFINDIKLANHMQKLRVIATGGNCIDTSSVGQIIISDTCRNSVSSIIVPTDTFTINTIEIYPNPSNNYISINYGNFATQGGYTISIMNNLGQLVFTSPINQPTATLDLSSWTGKGIYLVKIIDTQLNAVETRKIVLQ